MESTGKEELKMTWVPGLGGHVDEAYEEVASLS